MDRPSSNAIGGPASGDPPRSRLAAFLAELRRRRVFRALLAWGVVSFAVLQIIEPVMHGLDLPDWTLKVAIWALAAGFPITSVLAWIFDLGPGGIRRTADAEPGDGPAARPSRRRLAIALGGLVAASALLGAGMAALALRRADHLPPPGKDGRTVVAVADFANETSERELDSLSGLLITALEQSPHLRVLTRSRMFDVLRQLGREKVERIDETLAREVGRRTGTQALLLATIRRLGDSYVVDMRALDPVRDEYLFTVRDRASGKEAVFELVDRLGEASRRKLRAGAGSDPVALRGVASITTGSVTSWDQLFRARQAIDHLEFQKAHKLLDAALEGDPEFALAHYLLAVLATWEVPFVEVPEAQARAVQRYIEAAVRRAERLPEKERLLLHYIQAFHEKRFAEGAQLCDRAAEAYPFDKEAVFYAGDHRFHLLDQADSIPYFERALQLDPSYSLAKFHLADALASTGRAGESLDWLRREAGAGAGPVLRALARALLAAGREGEAAEAFERAADRDGNPTPAPAFAYYLAFHGRASEAEPALRATLARLPPATQAERANYRDSLWDALAATLVAQGRFADARKVLGGIRHKPEVDALLRLRLASATGSARVPEAIAALFRAGALEDGDVVALAGLTLADAGDPETAGRLASHARSSPAWQQSPPIMRRFLEALAAWGGGSPQLAEEGFRAVVAHPLLHVRYAGALLLGDLARARGDCAGAVAALEQARSVGWSPGSWHARLWSYPGLLHSLALCYEQTGDLARARERNDELLRMWSRADPGLPLLAEARALQQRLEKPFAAGSGKP